MTEFKLGDLIERRIDNKYYYKQTGQNPEYGIVLETKVKNFGAHGWKNPMTRKWVRVLWVGNKPTSGWHIVSPRLLKVGE